MGLRPDRKAAAPRATRKGGQVRQAGAARSSRIESMRALAALAVVVAHIYGSAYAYGPHVFSTFWHRVIFGGGFAVWLFFGLTGYLLYLPFARSYSGDAGPVDYKRYAINRAVRILPLYYAVVLVCMVLVAHGGSWGEWLRFGVFGENFSAKTVGQVDGPAWSLVVELHYYILLPFLAMAINLVARGSRRYAAAVLAVLGVAGALVRWFTYDNVSNPSQVWRYNLPVTFVFFIPGMLLALLKIEWEHGMPPWVRGPLASSGLWFLASLGFWALVFDHYNWDLYAAPASFLMIGAIVLPLASSFVVRVLEWRPLALLGVASYSLYLWHFPIVDHLASHQLKGDSFGVDLAVITPITIVVALVSYKVIEEPFLRMRSKWQGAAARSRS